MVHYAPPLSAVQDRPPICPKCGSHRTEIVGRSNNGDTIILRCNACGERSRVTLAAQAGDAAPEIQRPSIG